jgi:hypothetical protein
MNVTLAEKIETVVLARCSGAFGEFVEFEPGHYRVTCDGKTVIVRGHAIGWQVSFKGCAGIDASLIEAARLAFDGGSSRDVSRNYPL